MVWSWSPFNKFFLVIKQQLKLSIVTFKYEQNLLFQLHGQLLMFAAPRLFERVEIKSFKRVEPSHFVVWTFVLARMRQWENQTFAYVIYVPSDPLTLDLMEILDLFLRSACYHQNASYRKMMWMKVAEKNVRSTNSVLFIFGTWFFQSSYGTGKKQVQRFREVQS
jgi:hypothetical protein